jgi:hypothetical protein
MCLIIDETTIHAHAYEPRLTVVMAAQSGPGIPRSVFKTSDHAQLQGVGRRKNAAYMGECIQCPGQGPLTLTDEGHNAVIGC